MNIRIFLIILILISTIPGQLDPDDKLLRLPRELEIKLALSAAPKHLREKAGIYVLGKNGYELVKASENGWICYVNRGPRPWIDWLGPMCIDSEGMRTFGQRMFDRVKLRMQGLSREEVAEKTPMDTYPPFQKAGVVYMLSPCNQLPSSVNKGKTETYVPHMMFYYPDASNSNFGVSDEAFQSAGYRLSGLPFMVWENTRHGMTIVPLGLVERLKIAADNKDLITEMATYIELTIK